MRDSFTPEEVDRIENKAYEVGVRIGTSQERERIKVNIEKRIEELSSCNKNDDCAKIADYIESYLPEWLESVVADIKGENE